MPPTTPDSIVYAADGPMIPGWGARINATSTMIVGVHPTSAEDEMERIKEYSPGFDPVRFHAHEEWLLNEVRSWVQGQFGIELPAERTAVCGASAGGELALALGLRNPEMFGYVFSMSPGGGYRPPAVLPKSLPRYYLTAGTQEPWFLENAARWAEALRDAHADVVFTEREGEHGGPFWTKEFPRMVAWAFGT